ncbi:MAG: ATP-binding protein [bacterium]
MAFKDIIGQKRAVELLKSYIRGKRLHHTYLFVGPKGVGKTLSALNFAKALNCLNLSEDKEPCDECQFCKAIDGGYHPDVRLVTTPEEKRELGIDEIRVLRQSAYTTPAWGGWKVYIIERAEVLTREAGDALLKILEEPPQRCLFILLAPNVGDVPPTIASRSHIIRFLPVSKEEIAQFLNRKYGLNEDLAYSLASLSEGRPGYAITIAEKEDLKKVREDVIQFLLEMPTNPDYFLRAAERFLQIAGEIEEGEDRDKVQQCLLFASSFFRDLLILQLSGNPSLLINYDKRETLEGIYRNYNLEFIHSALNSLQRTYRLLQPGLNFNQQLCLEVMFLDILGGR